MKNIKRCDDISAWRLCMGCGACKAACPNQAVDLKDILDTGIRPFVDEAKCEKCGKCIEVCPGIGFSHEPFDVSVIEELRNGWGPILEIYEGYAKEDDVRFAGSSGGTATALSLFGIEQGGIKSILHVKADPQNPLHNLPVFSRTREDILQATGSRYAPAAPCQAFDQIKRTDGPCIFTGKPCDVAALRKAQAMDEELNEKIALAIGIFCAGTPSTNGTFAVLKAMGIEDPKDVKSFRYRGNGWPGQMTARCNDGKEYQVPYMDAWGGILTKHGQLRCRLCPDPTGEFADISCGDAWYRGTEGDQGRSLILARTQRGIDFLKQAIDRGYVTAQKVDPVVLPQSQQSVFNRRCNLWGRLFTMKLMRIPRPAYKGFSLDVCWKKLGLKDKIKAIVGTLRRIVGRKWYKPIER